MGHWLGSPGVSPVKPVLPTSASNLAVSAARSTFEMAESKIDMVERAGLFVEPEQEQGDLTSALGVSKLTNHAARIAQAFDLRHLPFARASARVQAPGDVPSITKYTRKANINFAILSTVRSVVLEVLPGMFLKTPSFPYSFVRLGSCVLITSCQVPIVETLPSC